MLIPTGKDKRSMPADTESMPVPKASDETATVPCLKRAALYKVKRLTIKANREIKRPTATGKGVAEVLEANWSKMYVIVSL